MKIRWREGRLQIQVVWEEEIWLDILNKLKW